MQELIVRVAFIFAFAFLGLVLASGGHHVELGKYRHCRRGMFKCPATYELMSLLAVFGYLILVAIHWASTGQLSWW